MYPVVSICGKFPIQEAPNGLPSAVSDARVRMLGCMDPFDYDQFHFCNFSYLILGSYLILWAVYFPGISFFKYNEARMLTGPLHR